MLYDAHLSTSRMKQGASILICGEPKAGDKLAVQAPNNDRFSGEVVIVSQANLTVLIDGKMFALDAWESGDDPLPLWNGPSSRWTAR